MSYLNFNGRAACFVFASFTAAWYGRVRSQGSGRNAGTGGGTDDEGMDADAARSRTAQAASFLLNPSEKPLPDDWAQLSPYQQTVTQLLFCESFGLLLMSGVPILQAMEQIATLAADRAARADDGMPGECQDRRPHRFGTAGLSYRASQRN